MFPVVLPALRERRQDIPALAEHFVNRVAARMNKSVRTLTPEGLDSPAAVQLAGNIRELENVIERAMILAQGPTLQIPPLRNATTAEAPVLDGDDLAAVNRAHIISVLEATGWVVSGPHGAAARLGVKRSTLNYRMKKLGIRSRAPAAC